MSIESLLGPGDDEGRGGVVSLSAERLDATRSTGA